MAAPRPVIVAEGAKPEERGRPALHAAHSSDAILLARPLKRSVRWGLMLTVLTRFLSALWILRALTEWALVLGATPEGPVFEQATPQTQLVIASLAVLHCIVGVGLWLSWSWGGMLWLMLSAAEVCLYVMAPQSGLVGPSLLVFFAIFAIIYSGMTLLERRENS